LQEAVPVRTVGIVSRPLCKNDAKFRIVKILNLAPLVSRGLASP
jgi:hypothetical protein